MGCEISKRGIPMQKTQNPAGPRGLPIFGLEPLLRVNLSLPNTSVRSPSSGCLLNGKPLGEIGGTLHSKKSVRCVWRLARRPIPGDRHQANDRSVSWWFLLMVGIVAFSGGITVGAVLGLPSSAAELDKRA